MCVRVSTSEGMGQLISCFLAPVQKSALSPSGLTIPGYAPAPQGKPEVELQLTGLVALETGAGFVVGPIAQMQILKEVALGAEKETNDDKR